MDLTFDTEALQTITFVRRYPVDNDIRKRQFVFEEAFHDTFPDPARVVNLPTNAPPEVPRFWFVHGKRSLQVNSITAQMNLDFTDGTPEDFDLFKIITRLRTHKRAFQSGHFLIQGLRRETIDGSRLFLAERAAVRAA